MPLSFPAIESALVAFVETASGLSGKVVLAMQTAPQPPMPYATVRISGPRPAGGPWPRIIQSFDAAQPAGQEVSLQAVVDEELTVSLQFFTALTFGAGSARALMAQVRVALALQSTLDPLRAAGLALIDVGDIHDLSAILETAFQGRAALDLRFLVADDVTERTGYVGSVGISGTVSGDGASVTVNKTVTGG
jgi:hypothetical protein